MFHKTGLAIGVMLILTGTAWISGTASTNPHLAYTLVAFMAFGLDLADGTTMGFLFMILALPKIGWMEALLMASAAQMILVAVRREHPEPKALLESLMANAAAVLTTQLVFHAPNLQRFDQPIRLMLASGVCFLTLRIIDVQKRDVWSFAYYPVAGAIAALFPISALLPPLVYLTWRSCRLYERRLKKQREQSRKVASLHLRTIEALAQAIEARDQPASRNPRRVQIYCIEMAKAMNLPEMEIEALRAASLLYDIGEMAVPENIILKPGPLTPDEYEKVKIHPVVGAEILERVQFPYPVAPIVLAHHERWDGKGYPNGLSGEAIPIGARVLAVVDTFDALISARHHRCALSVEDALQRIRSESGRAYDPKIAALLEKRHKAWERLATATPARRFESILSAQREVQVVLDLTQKLGSSLELSDTFAALKPALQSLIPFETLAVWVERDGMLAAEYVAGEHLAVWSSLHIPLGAGVSGKVAAKAELMVNGDATEEFAHAGIQAELVSARFVLGVPLESGGIRGTLALYRSGEPKFTFEDARVLSMVAPKLSVAVANGLRFQMTASQAATDSLTGLPNASALFSRLEAGSPAAVLICDLDGFKLINDTHGHLTGNRLLEGLASAFRRSCRGSDFVARMGGDEFVMVLEGIGPEEIGARIAQFRDLVRAVGREVCGGDVLDASFGAAFCPVDGTTPNELLAFADRQMYRRKAENKAGVRKIERIAGA